MRRPLGPDLRSPALRAALILCSLAACIKPSASASDPTRSGMIAGMVRDADTGTAISQVIVVVRRPGELEPIQEITDGNGAYMIPSLPPGDYQVTAYAEQVQIGDRATVVRPDEIVGLDFTVMRGGNQAPDLNAPGAPDLWHYRPPNADPSTGTIEGIVADQQQTRLTSAVVSLVRTGDIAAQQTVTDDHGRFTFADLAPGTYDLSAYYAVVRRGQLEVRRNRVVVDGGEVVVVPLWLSTDR